MKLILSVSWTCEPGVFNYIVGNGLLQMTHFTFYTQTTPNICDPLFLEEINVHLFSPLTSNFRKTGSKNNKGFLGGAEVEEKMSINK